MGQLPAPSSQHLFYNMLLFTGVNYKNLVFCRKVERRLHCLILIITIKQNMSCEIKLTHAHICPGWRLGNVGAKRLSKHTCDVQKSPS